jgi:hypothetical protein
MTQRRGGGKWRIAYQTTALALFSLGGVKTAAANKRRKRQHGMAAAY